ncbi:testis-specific expressed protein 55 [Acomys russatus]|uniref:testis-specific expressed protein 55 n=1 Tax=Acomys russatus TaxID=60746 RepID=UPI0021E295C2|nr:testis-specific expressed protein 55 [Acomys russatus]
MDEPPQEAPDESSNHENAAQLPDNRKTKGEGGAGQATNKGSEHAGVGSSESTDDQASSQGASSGSRRTEQRAYEELTEHRSPGRAERKASQQVDRRSSGQAERRTSESPNQQLPSSLEGKASERTDRGTSGYADQVPSDSGVPGKSQRQVYNQDGYQTEDFTDEYRFSEDEETDYEHGKEADYHLYCKTLGQSDNQSSSEDNKDVRAADHKIQPCMFEDSPTEIRSKVSTGGETESSGTIQGYNPPDTEFTSDTQSSYEKLPSITTKVYYSSSQDKYQTTEITTDVTTEFEQRKGSQRHSHTPRRRFPPIVFEDPYQVALRYMEKHNILQVFQQITENLVYEKPDDPLDFMLGQVQEMIRQRDERQGI